MVTTLQTRKLGELLEIKHGFAFLGEHFAEEGTHIVLTPGNFFDEGGFKHKGDKEKWYRGPIPPDYVLNEGDLIVAMTEQAEGLLGSSAIIPKSGLYLHNQRLGLVQIRDPEQIDKHFAYYLFNSKPVRQQIRGSASGTKIRHTAPSRIADVKVSIPPAPVQRRIAGILSAYDELIENSQRRIKILEAMARALYREALGAGKDSAASRPIADAPYWRFISENVSNYAGTKRYYATADIEGLAVTGPGIDYSFADKPSRAQKQPIANSVWFARMKDTYKIAWYGPRNDEHVSGVILSSGFAGFEARDPELWPLLFLILSSKEFHVQKDLYCTGATQMSLTNEGLARIMLPLPSEQSARRLGRDAGLMLNAIAGLQRRNENLRRTRDLLLPRLLSGQIDVGAMPA
jgi:type I restriction enzyme S subunit